MKVRDGFEHKAGNQSYLSYTVTGIVIPIIPSTAAAPSRAISLVEACVSNDCVSKEIHEARLRLNAFWNNVHGARILFRLDYDPLYRF